ncbi:hypothetical protein ACEE21_14725 [Clostridium baratii]
MIDKFLKIRNKVKDNGTKIGENRWKLKNCVYESFDNKEMIKVEDLLEVYLVETGGVVFVEGSLDAFVFLEFML